MNVKSAVALCCLAVFLMSACGSTNKREIKKTAIDTEDARLTGYLEALQSASCSPLCTPLNRDIDIEDEVVLDEAMLRKNENEACFDVVVRTTLGYDVPLDDLTPTCLLDGEVAVGKVSTETFSIYEYGTRAELESADSEGEGASPEEEPDEDEPEFRVVATEMTQADLEEKAGETSVRNYFAGEDYSLSELRVSERKGRICCPGDAATTVQLTLSNGVNPEATEATDPPSGIDFVWFIIE